VYASEIIAFTNLYTANSAL